MFKISKWILPYICVIFILGFKHSIFLSFFWIILHELIHCITALSFGIKVNKIALGPLGATLELDKLEHINYKKEMMIYLSGPILNLALALIFYFLGYTYDNNFISYSFRVNLVLGCFNLLPASPLDGWRALRLILNKKISYRESSNISIFISYIIASLIFLIFILLLSIHKLNLSLLLCSFFMFFCSYKEKKKVTYIIMDDVINKKKRFKKDKCLESKVISVYYKEKLLDIFKMLDKGKFSYFLILNDDMKVVADIYEGELIDALKKYGNITLEEFLIKD